MVIFDSFARSFSLAILFTSTFVLFHIILFVFNSVSAVTRSPEMGEVRDIVDNKNEYITGENISFQKVLEELYHRLNNRDVDENPLEEILEEGAPALNERYRDAKIRLRKRLPLDSLFAHPDVNLSVFIEEHDRLSAELWNIHFVQDGDTWKAESFHSMMTARLGFRFSLRKEEVYAFDRLVIEVPAGVFYIEDGMVMPGFSGDLIGRAVITGKGRFDFTPPDMIERHQINKYARTSAAVYSTRFDQMVLILTPEGYGKIVQRTNLSRVKGGRAFKQAESLLSRVEKDYLMDMDPAQERFALTHSNPTFLKAEIDLSDSNRWLVYTSNPFESEAVSLVQKSGFPRNSKLNPPVTWASFPYSSLRQPSANDEAPPSSAFSVRHYGIEGTLEKNRERLRIKASIDVVATADTLSTIIFSLNPELEVVRVEYANGRGALYTRQGRYVAVPFLQPITKGTTTSLTLWYEGDVFHKSSDAFFGTLKNQEWLPVHSNDDFYTFDLELCYPKELTVVTGGAVMSDYMEGIKKISRWRGVNPISSLGITFSEAHTRKISIGGVCVSLNMYKDAKIINSSEEKIIDLITPLLDFYSRIFGPYPYKKLDVVQMPIDHEFGEALPSVLMLWGMYFLDSFRLDMNLPAHTYTEVQQVFRSFLAHELAHQWWGIGVIPKTYRDAWLSEAIATYAADMYIENEIGPQRFRGMLKRHVAQSLHVDRHGPVELGRRLREHYQTIVYEKGAMVLHMLRHTIGNKNFMDVLSIFYRDNAGKLITTKDFEAVVEAVTGREMDWFFDQWIRSTGYPVYRMYYTDSQGPGLELTVHGQLIQEQKGRVFRAVVPLVIELKNGEKIVKVIRNTQRRQTFKFTVPAEVNRIAIAPNYSVYFKKAN